METIHSLLANYLVVSGDALSDLSTELLKNARGSVPVDVHLSPAQSGGDGKGDAFSDSLNRLSFSMTGTQLHVKARSETRSCPTRPLDS